MRVFPVALLLLAAAPAAADWDRLRPVTELPPMIAPAPDAACRAQAQAVDEVIRRALEAVRTVNREAGMRIEREGLPGRRRFVARCITPRSCPAFTAAEKHPGQSDQLALTAYEQVLTLCSRPE